MRGFLAASLLLLFTIIYTCSPTSNFEWYYVSLQSLLLRALKHKPEFSLQIELERQLPQNPLRTPEEHRDPDACTNPRVRREWRALTEAQKEAWIGACLAKLPSSEKVSSDETHPTIFDIPHNKSGSYYDDFSYVHMSLNAHIHQTGLFFPWHRYYLWSFEHSLNDLCNYTGVSPYWDWSQDAVDFEHSTIFNDSNPKSGLGGFGERARGSVVVDGGFAELALTYPSSHTLRRQYTPYPFLNLSHRLYPNQTLEASSTFTTSEVNKIVSSFQGDFKGFQSYFEAMQGAHMSVHMIMGGDLGGICLKSASEDCNPEAEDDVKWSPNEPLFWLHHAMVDKVWYDWQRAHVDNFWAFEAGTVRDLRTWPKYPTGAPPAMSPDFILPRNGMLLGNYTVQHMFNTTSDSPLCYIYE